MERELKEKEYLAYINEHIANVKTAYYNYRFQLCSNLVISAVDLYNNILVHDDTKYSEEEFEGYRQWFYPCSDEEKNKELFDKAWEHHYLNNPHHPEYWCDRETNEPTDMPDIYIAEMLLDWAGMGIKFGDTAYEYYMKTRDTKPLSENTKKKIDRIIKIFK